MFCILGTLMLKNVACSKEFLRNSARSPLPGCRPGCRTANVLKSVVLSATLGSRNRNLLYCLQLCSGNAESCREFAHPCPNVPKVLGFGDFRKPKSQLTNEEFKLSPASRMPPRPPCGVKMLSFDPTRNLYSQAVK